MCRWTAPPPHSQASSTGPSGPSEALMFSDGEDECASAIIMSPVARTPDPTARSQSTAAGDALHLKLGSSRALTARRGASISLAGPLDTTYLRLLLLQRVPTDVWEWDSRAAYSWDVGVLALWRHDVCGAVTNFMHSAPPLPPGFRKSLPLSATWLMFWLVLEAQQFGITPAWLLTLLRVEGARTLQSPLPLSLWPRPGRGMPFCGQACRTVAMRGVVGHTLVRHQIGLWAEKRVGTAQKIKVKHLQTLRSTVVTDQCSTATLLVNAACGAMQMWFVDPVANPNWQTGSMQNPFCELRLALLHCRQGDTIVLLPGRYKHLQVDDVQGPYHCPVHIRGYSRAGVLVGVREAKETRHRAAVTIRNCRNLLLSHMTVCNAKVGVHVDLDCSYIRLESIDAQHVGYTVDVPDVHNHVIEVCRVQREGPGRSCLGVFLDGMLLGDFTGVRAIFPRKALGAMYLLQLCFSFLCCTGALAIAASFYEENHNNNKVNLWLFTVMLAWLACSFFKYPVLIAFGWFVSLLFACG